MTKQGCLLTSYRWRRPCPSLDRVHVNGAIFAPLTQGRLVRRVQTLRTLGRSAGVGRRVAYVIKRATHDVRADTRPLGVLEVRCGLEFVAPVAALLPGLGHAQVLEVQGDGGLVRDPLVAATGAEKHRLAVRRRPAKVVQRATLVAVLVRHVGPVEADEESGEDGRHRLGAMVNPRAGVRARANQSALSVF